MAVREILIYPRHKEELRRKSAAVTEVKRPVRRLIRDLKDTLQASQDGIGLAAPQINVHQRVIIVCPGSEMEAKWRAGPPIALVNPQIIEARDEGKDFDGCLSFPGLYGETIRPHYLRVIGLDEEGQPFDRVFEGFNAVLVHHEIDHLDGVLFIDRIEKLEDLYRLSVKENGELVRLQVSGDLKVETTLSEAARQVKRADIHTKLDEQRKESFMSRRDSIPGPGDDLAAEFVSKEDLIQGLNEDLAAEWGTVIRYTYQASKSFGVLGVELREMFNEETQDELGHAAFLTDVIIDLGGEPTTLPKEFARADGLKNMLEQDLEMELEDVKNYIKHARIASDLGLIELQMKLEEMAADESGHARELRRILKGL